MKTLSVVLISALLIASATAQTASPSLISSPELSDYLKTKVLPTTCVKEGFDKAITDISMQDLVTWSIRTYTVNGPEAAGFSKNTYVIAAIQAAMKPENLKKVQVASSPADNWSDSTTVRNVQDVAYAVYDGTNVSYYHIMYQLNLKDKPIVDTQENYIGAMVYIACLNTQQWISSYLA